MSEATLNHLIDQLGELNKEQLVQVRDELDKRLPPDPAERESAFEKALLEAGLLTEIKPRRTTRPSRELMQVEGAPASETLIEERR